MAPIKALIREKWFGAAGAAPARLVLRDLELDVAQGETVVLTGPSGCGKTTLLNIVAGLEKAFDGEVLLPQGTRLGYVFQEPRLLPWRTVEENLALVLPRDALAPARICRALADVGLEGAGRVYASRLSLGMARRVALARAFVVRPSLLLLDEPFASLDEPTARRLRLLLLDLLARHDTTALFVTHDLHEAIMLADRILVLSASPARIARTIRVDLDHGARRDRSAVEAFRAHLPTAEALLESPVAESLP
jgi:NitT/TauT family transport system ATP-binding protein